MAIISLKYSTTADSRPDPSLLTAGEVAINTNSVGSGVFYASDTGDLLKAGSAEVSATAPNATPTGFPGNSTGELWLDTTTNTLKVWSGSSWLSSTPSATTTVVGTLYGRTNTTTTALLGYNAGGSGTGACNTLIGANSGCSLTTGCWNTFTGTCSGMSITTGVGNSLFGLCAGFGLTTGSNNTVIGRGSGIALTIANSSIVVGINSLQCATTGSNNTVLGSTSGNCITSGSFNILLGSTTTGITTGSNNIAIQSQSLSAPVTGSDNIAIGRLALCCTTNCNNIGIGYAAGAGTTTGISNIAIGICAMVLGVNTGGCNVAIGTGALCCATGTQNVALGHTAGNTLTTGDKNVLIGSGVCPGSVTGSCQLVIGFAAGQNWLCGDSSKNIRPGAGIVDNLGCIGTNGQVLASCLSGIRWISAASGSLTSITAGTGLSGGTITSSGTISLNTACVIAPTAFTGKGVLLTASAASSPTALTVGTNGQFLSVNSACTGGLEWSTITQCTGTVTSVVAGTGLTGGTITGSGTLALNSACVINPTVLTAKGSVLAASAASTPAEVAIGTDSYILTACSTCTAGLTWTPACTGTVTNVTGTSPVSVATGASTPVISVATASTTAIGVTQLVDNTTTNDATKALTSAQGYALQQQLNSLASAGGLILAATLDAATGLALTVTTAGAAAGFTVGAALPSPAAGNENLFAIVTVGGSYTPPGGSTPYAASQGDWFLSNGTAWSFLNVGVDVAYATTTVAGTICLATNAQVVTGTATNLAVAPAGLAAAYIANSAITAKGDLIAGSAVATATALAVGTNGKFLAANSACITGLEWITGCSGTVTSVVAGTGLTGGTITGSGTIALDTACAINPSVLSAKGTLVTASAASTPSGLAVGTNGQYLAANSACADGLEWVTSGGSPNATPLVAGILKGCNAEGSLSNYLGFDSGKCITSGTFNTLQGYCVAPALTSGGFNTAVGTGALLSSTTGSCNIAVGYAATALTTGIGNTIVGHQAGASTTTGGRNTFIGQESGISTTGQFNVALGACSLYTTSGLGTGSCNVAIGFCVSLPSLTGSCQLVLGFANGCYWLTGCSDKSIQLGAGLRDCTGALGTAGQVLSSTGSGVCWIPSGGNGTVTSITAGTGLTGGIITTSGTVALNTACVIAPSLLTGAGSLITASGSSTPAQLVVGSDGQVLTACSTCASGLTWSTGGGGGGSLATPTVAGALLGCDYCSGGSNYLGYLAGASNTAGANNVFIGFSTGFSNTTGVENTAVGFNALCRNTVGYNNTAVGAAIQNLTYGAYNVAVGSLALNGIIGACLNTAIGHCAAGTTTGTGNTALGALTMASTPVSGCYNVAIGYNVTPATASGSCQLTIGFGIGCYWLRGFSNKSVQFGGAIADVTGSTGGALTFLQSNGVGTGVQWASIPSATPCAAGIVTGKIVANSAAIGNCAMLCLTTGVANVAMGGRALCSTTTGNYNTALGAISLEGNTTGIFNTAVGTNALRNNTTGNNNVAVGVCSMRFSTTGCRNTVMGTQAGSAISTGSDNVIVGAVSGGSITTGSGHIAIGCGAMAGPSANTGLDNIAIGRSALRSSTTGNNVAIGFNSSCGLTTGCRNVAVGPGALSSATTAEENTAIGSCAMGTGIATGLWNTAIGSGAGYRLTSGSNNTVVGSSAGCVVTTGSCNTLLGCSAGMGVTSGSSNIVIGAVTGITEGIGNIVMGAGAMSAENVALDSVAIGRVALACATCGVNVAIGYSAGGGISTGICNVALGAYALNAPLNTGSCSLAIGSGALQFSTGSCNIGIGAVAGGLVTTGTNVVVIGAGGNSSVATVSNEVTIWNGLRGARFQGASASAWTFLSDARDKTNIQDLALGLEFINALQPRKFEWYSRDTDADHGIESSGFIAQEVLEVVKTHNAEYSNLVSTCNPDQYSFAQANLVPFLVNAIKELTAKVNTLEEKLSALG